MPQTDATGQLSWLLDNLVNQVEHVEQAVILSTDGLVVASSQTLAREDGEHSPPWPAACRAWPREQDSILATATYARSSSSWKRRSCSSSLPATGRAWLCGPPRTRT